MRDGLTFGSTSMCGVSTAGPLVLQAQMVHDEANYGLQRLCTVVLVFIAYVNGCKNLQDALVNNVIKV